MKHEAKGGAFISVDPDDGTVKVTMEKPIITPNGDAVVFVDENWARLFARDIKLHADAVSVKAITG